MPATQTNNSSRSAADVASLAFLSATAWAQNDSSGQSGGAPPAASTPAEINAENPPLSGLDAPSAEPALWRPQLPGAGNSAERVCGFKRLTATRRAITHVAEVSRGLGSLDLQKIWKTYQFGLDYIAGGVFYLGPHSSGQSRSYQVHTFAA